MEIRKGQLTMELKRLKETQDSLTWPSDSDDLPIINWESCKQTYFCRLAHSNQTLVVQDQSKTRPLIVIAGFIHDVSDFLDEHPGGRHFLIKFIGKDATTAFFGGIYDHSNAAHNVSTPVPLCSLVSLLMRYWQLLAMKRVGVLHGGMQHGLDDKCIPPSQRLRIMRYNEMGSSTSSSSAGTSDGEDKFGSGAVW